MNVQTPKPEKKEPTIDELKIDASKSKKIVDDLDGQIKKLSTQRAEENKKLRSLTGRIVTLQLED